MRPWNNTVIQVNWILLLNYIFNYLQWCSHTNIFFLAGSCQKQSSHIMQMTHSLRSCLCFSHWAPSPQRIRNIKEAISSHKRLLTISIWSKDHKFTWMSTSSGSFDYRLVTHGNVRADWDTTAKHAGRQRRTRVTAIKNSNKNMLSLWTLLLHLLFAWTHTDGNVLLDLLIKNSYCMKKRSEQRGRTRWEARIGGKPMKPEAQLNRPQRCVILYERCHIFSSPCVPTLGASHLVMIEKCIKSCPVHPSALTGH